MAQYKQHINHALSASARTEWRAGVEKHSAQVPYYLFQHGPSTALVDSKRCNLTWAERLNLRGWCQLRAGLLVFRHLQGRRSQAKFQHCIFCDTAVRNATVHVLSICGCWTAERSACLSLLNAQELPNDQKTLAILRVCPSSRAFKQVLSFAAALADSAGHYWSGVIV